MKRLLAATFALALAAMLAHVPSFWVQAIYGAVILAALMLTKRAGGDA